MKRLLFLLLLLPSVILAQTDSWVKFAVQYDYWAPSESAFTFVSDANGDTVLDENGYQVVNLGVKSV